MRYLRVLSLVWACRALGAYADTTQCPTTVVEGVDVSASDGMVTWSSVSLSGRAFAFAKATQGNYDTDVDFATNWANIKSAALLRSALHFFDPTIDGITQANAFLSTLSGAGGLQPGDLPPTLDLECPTSSVQASANANCEFSGNSGWVPTSELTQRVFDWLTTVQAATGRTPIIYSYPSWFADVDFTDARLATYPLYISSIGACFSVPAPWVGATFWQYSFNGSVSGITGQADLDRFVGSPAALQVFVDTVFADGFE
jgi:lysozyme